MLLFANAVADIHRALNRDIGNELSCTDNAHSLKTCHIGQPVAEASQSAIGSRTLFEAWPAGGVKNSQRHAILADVATVIGKINLILRTGNLSRTGGDFLWP